jgi:hypothetical protein
MTTLKGIVKVDASYVIAVGGGNFVSTNSGTVIATGGGNVISVGGGNVISVGGGNVIATGGGNYAVLDTPDAKPGEVYPVKDMGVVAVSLSDGKPLSVAVRTNDKGEYEVSVPEALKENVLIMAGWPGMSKDDPLLKNPRLQYSLVVAPQALTAVEVNENTSLITRYIRETFQNKFVFYFNSDVVVNGSTQNDDLVPDVLKVPAEALKTELRTAIDAAKIPPANVPELARQSADLLISQLDLGGMKIEKLLNPDYPEDPVMPTIIGIVELMQNAAGARLAEGMKFEDRPYVKEANAARPEGQKYQFLKASDVCEFIVKEYFGKNFVQFEKSKAVWADLGLTETQRLTMNACANSIGFNMAKAMFTDQNGIKTRLITKEIPKFGTQP